MQLRFFSFFIDIILPMLLCSIYIIVGFWVYRKVIDIEQYLIGYLKGRRDKKQGICPSLDGKSIKFIKGYRAGWKKQKY